jgi:hypothetical protein
MPVITGTKGPTVIVTVRNFVGSCTDVAVTVTAVLEATTGAVNTAVVPEAEMVPALAVNVTPGLKLPVPYTTAEHELVWPDIRVSGAHVRVPPVIVIGVTGVIVPPLDPPPPGQPQRNIVPAAKSPATNIFFVFDIFLLLIHLSQGFFYNPQLFPRLPRIAILGTAELIPPDEPRCRQSGDRRSQAKSLWAL